MNISLGEHNALIGVYAHVSICAPTWAHIDMKIN